MKRKMSSRGWRTSVTCLSAVIVFVTAYALVLPAITMTGSHPSLQAEELTAVSGEELTVRVTAKADAGETEKTVILIADGEGADLSASYVFNEDGICVITDETGKEIELHRSARENRSKKQVIDYWFTLSAEEETSFTLDLIDEVDQNRFAKLVEAVQESAQESAQASENTAAAAGETGTASASNAEKAAPAAAATSSNASRATGSNADIIEANAAAADPEERIVTEENDSGFTEILDGKVVNDLADADSSDDEDEERVRARIRLSAGIGNDYAASVKDAERNADKRGDAELKLTWTEKPEESSFVKPDLTVSVGDAKIAVICEDETVLPADARVSAYEIAFGTPEYEALAAQAAGAVAENTGNEKSVTRARFFDITIYDGEGNEIQPEGDVKVVITYEKQNASEDDGEMNVVHFGEDGPEVVDLEAAETADDRDSMEFTASSFSIYGVVYTVDFEYELNGTVFTYQLEGGESISLKQLIAKLGVLEEEKAEGFVDSQVENVTFSDESLVKVTREGGDWKLESIAPFSTEEVLTVSLKDGRLVTVKVTDTQATSDLTDFVSNVVITGAVKTEDGKYHVEAGEPYTIIITFEEDSGHQFDNRANLTYHMPEGITVLTRQTGPGTVNIVYKGRTYYVDYNYVLDTNGTLTVKFDETDPDFHRLEESTNVSFFIKYEGAFDASETEIIFSDDVVREVILDDPKPGSAYAQKSASYDEKNGVFSYTIKVTADGDVTNVNVKDLITGSALIFNNDVVVSGNSSTPTGGVTGNGFDYTFPSMSDGEEITISYTANVDFSKATKGRITADQTKNTVTVQPEGGDPHTSEYSREITLTSKSDGTEVETTADGDKIIEWTIDYNLPALVPVGGDTITDRIGDASVKYMKYYGNDITVKVFKRDGTEVRTEDVPYTSLTSHGVSSWTYTIPAADTEPYRYRITYRTVVDMTEVNSFANVVYLENTANNDYGGISVKPDNGAAVVKEVESFTTEEINWVATIDIPKGGLTSAVVTDTLPFIRMDDGYTVYSDLFKEGSLQIDGLLDDESYDVVPTASNVTITFYYQADGEKVPGLRGTPDGRTITVRLTTKVNQDWLQEGYKVGGRVQNHTNTIVLNGVSDTATVTYGKGIKKTGTKGSYSDSILYSLLLANVSKVPVIVEDTFDTSLLEVDTRMAGPGSHMKIWGGTQYSQIAGGIPVNYTDTSDGITLTANEVPMQPDGHYYPYYRIDYYLKLKDGVDLNALAIAHGGEFDLVNTAKWGGHESTFTYETKYEYLNKELVNAEELGGENRTATYRITFNSAKAVLNNGEPMTMTDTLSNNLSVDYSSISITTDPAGISVPYSLSGGEGGTTVATYTVPDGTEVVITYNALIVGTGTQPISNKVVVKKREKTVETTVSNLSDTKGQGGISSFKIVKVDGYDASKKLPGVRFKIFAENPELDFGAKVNHVKEIELLTDENGEICLDGAVYDLFFNEVYHVQEIEPPEDYGAISFDYKVTLTDEMQLVNYGQFIYHYSDSMQIKNWPLEGLVVEKQVESGIPADKDRYYTFRISVLNEEGEVDTDYNEKHGDDQFDNGVFEFQLKDKEQKMFKDFLKGTEYLVEELDADGFTVSVSYNIYDEDGKITDTKTDQGTSHRGELTQEDEVIVFKNSKKGDLKVSKVLVSNEAADADREFTFLVKLDDESITGEYGDMTFTEGAAAVKLKGGESAAAEGLPAGITYTVTEEETEGFVVGKTGDTGTITMENESEAVFTNTRDTGDLEVKKILKSDAAADADREFEFTVTLGKLGDIRINGTYGDMTFSEGAATFKLKGGEKATAEGLPAGITYTVTEADAQGFELVGKTGDTGTINKENKSEAVFTNARTGSLSTQFEARKTMKGRELEEGDVYSFRLYDAAGNTLQEKMNDSSGKVTFDPIVFTASDLPAVSSDSNAGGKEKTLTWRIREVIPEGAVDNVKGGIKYDASEYSVSVTLRYNYETGKYEVGEPVYKAGENVVHAAEFINEELRDFEFSKVWKNGDKEIKWPEKVGSITVTLRRTAQSAGGDQNEEKAVFTVKPDSISIAENAGSDFTALGVKLDGEEYRYKITDLAKYTSDGTEWIYSISETTVEGFNKPAYFIINADGEKEEQPSSEATSFAEPGTTGGVEIVNDEILFELPSTGGPGTVAYTLGGAALLLISALMYTFRMRRRAVR